MPSYLDFNFIIALSFSPSLSLFPPHCELLWKSRSLPNFGILFSSVHLFENYVTKYFIQIQEVVDWTGHEFISDGQDITTDRKSVV